MLSVLSDRREIDAAQERLTSQLFEDADQSGKAMLGFQGGHQEGDVAWFRDLDLWFCYRRLHRIARHWNCFGFGNPFMDRNRPIVVEATMPFSGVNRRFAGGFAVDEDGVTYLIHRGKIGGGRKGVGKVAFLERWGDAGLVEATDGGQVSAVIVLGILGDEGLRVQLHTFVEQVEAIKKELVNGRRARSPRSTAASADLPVDAYKDEFSGPKRFATKRNVEAQVNHGIVVRHLRDELAQRGVEAFRDGKKDLYTGRKRTGIEALFEVKTYPDTTSVYTAIGQLFVNATDRQTKLVGVFPSGLSKRYVERIEQLGIRVVTFAFNDAVPEFVGLDRALA